MQTIGERIRTRRNELKLTQGELAKQVGIKQQSLQAIETGKTKQPKNLFEISQVLGVSVEWLANGVEFKNESNFIELRLKPTEWKSLNNEGEFVEVPVFNLSVATSSNRFTKEAEQELYTLPFRANTLQQQGISIKDLRVLKVTGDSMEPKFSDGDVVSINLSDTTIRDGKIYAVRISGIKKVKVLIQNLNGSVTLRSFNQAFKDEIIELDQLQSGDFQIIGRVWWISSIV